MAAATVTAVPSTSGAPPLSATAAAVAALAGSSGKNVSLPSKYKVVVVLAGLFCNFII